MATIIKADPELCHAVAAWMDETVATGEMEVVDKDGKPLPSWEIKYPRIGSHNIYATTILADLPPGVTYLRTDVLRTDDGRVVRLGARTVAQVEVFESQSVAGPKGAEPFDPDVSKMEVVFGGHELARALDLLLTGEDAGGRFFGRGSAHRASVAHLAAQ